MKWFLVIVLSLAYCAAEEYEYDIQVVSLPPSPPEQNVNLTRIIGGNSASIQKYPFAVQMLYQRRLSCGGSLITVRHVLTAAHCFYYVNTQTQQIQLYNLKDFSIIAGSANYQKGGSSRTISRLIVHPAYSASSRDNDVAVFVLNKNLKESNSIKVAPLPQQGNLVPDNAIVWTVGWGTTVFGQDRPPTSLQEVQLWVVNRTVCTNNYLALEAQYPREQYRVSNTMICAGVLNQGGRDACQGDSGGPLLYSGIVVGVTSWGYQCAHPLYPGVNAMTSAYTNWIQDTVRMYNAGPPMGSISGILVFTSLISSIFINSQL